MKESGFDDFWKAWPLSKSQFEMLILHSQSLLGEIGEGGG
jgi:hypothetical protein